MSTPSMQDAVRTLDFISALSLKQEGSGGVAAYKSPPPDADFALLVPAEDAGATMPEANVYTDDNSVAKGHEFATQKFTEYWNGDIQRKYKANPFTDMFYFFYLFGDYSVVETEAGKVWTHTFKLRDLQANGIILPSFSTVEKLRVIKQLFGCVVANMSYEIFRKSTADMSCTMRHSGLLGDNPDFTFPEVKDLVYYQAANATYELAKFGESYVDIREIFHKATFNHTNTFSDELCHFAGSGVQAGAGSKGQVKGVEVLTKREFSVDLETVDVDTSLWGHQVKDETVKLKMKLESQEFVPGSTTNKFYTGIEFHQLSVNETKHGAIDDIAGWTTKLTPIAKDVAATDLITVEVQNDIEEMGVVPA